MKSKLIILGSGSSAGVPRIDGFWGNCKKNKKNIRTRCSAVILSGPNSILIDTSPDIRNQLLLNKVKNVTSVIYTHEHSDQTNGLFELRPFYWKNKKKINIYGNLQTINFLKKRFDFCFNKKKFYDPIVKANIVKKEFLLGETKSKISFKTVEVKHGLIKSVAYIFKKTAYISDCNDMSIAKMNIFKNLNYLILDCCKIKTYFSHFNLGQALKIQNQLKPKKTILTNLHNDFDYYYLLKKLPKNVLPADDGLTLNL